MKITINRFLGGYDGKNCYVHARASALDENNLILTMQDLNVAGCDDFSPLLVMKSADGGKTWTEPAPDDAFITEYDENGHPLKAYGSATMVVDGDEKNK